MTQFANRGKKESNNRGLQALQIAHQHGSYGMHCTLKDVQKQLAELKAKIAVIGKTWRVGMLRGDNGAVKPNKGESGMLSDGKLDKGKKKVGFDPVLLPRPRHKCGGWKGESGRLHLKWVLH